MDKPLYLRLEKPTAPLRVGESHWWGYPDLPPDVDIPTVYDEPDDMDYGLTFLCQINLADLPQRISSLPHEGLLLFFADIAYYCGQWDEPSIGCCVSDNKVVRVLYVPKADMARVVSRQREYAEEAVPPMRIVFCDERQGLELSDHRLLGEPEYREWDDWDAPYNGWQLLLQMDSCEIPGGEYNFMDVGVLNIIVSPEALRKLDFSDARGIILST